MSQGAAGAIVPFLPRDSEQTDNGPHVRILRPYDHPDVRRLMYTCLGWSIKDAHLRYIELSKLIDAGSRGELDVVIAVDSQGKALGMLLLKYRDKLRAEIRSLLLPIQSRSAGLTQLLVDYAMEYCRHQGLLKVVLDSHVVAPREALNGFDGKGWRCAKSGTHLGTEFYLDLYYRDDEPYKLDFGADNHADHPKQ